MMSDKHIELSDQEFAYIVGSIKAAIEWREAKDVNPRKGADGSGDGNVRGLDTLPDKWKAVLTNHYWDLMREAGRPSPLRSFNIILPKLISQAAAVLGGRTKIVVTAEEESLGTDPYMVGGMITSTWHKLGFDDRFEDAWWDSRRDRHGVLRSGWRFERDGYTRDGERDEPVVPEDAQPLPMEAITRMSGPPIEEMREFGTPEEAVKAVEEAMRRDSSVMYGDPLYDDPVLERVSPQDLIVDPSCKRWDLSDAKYVFERKWRSVGDLQADKQLKNTRDLKGRHFTYRQDLSNEYLLSETLPEMCEVEIYDGYAVLPKNGKKRILHVILAADHEKPLMVKESPYLDDDGRSIFPNDNPYPFIILPSTPVVDRDCYLPESIMHYVADLQIAYDRARSNIVDVSENTKRISIVPEGEMDNKSLHLLRFAKDGDIVPLPRAAFDSIKPLEWPQIPRETYSTASLIENDMNRTVGVSEYDEGVLPEGERKATEVRAMQASGQVRTGGAAEMLNRAKRTAAGHVIALFQKFQADPKRFRWTDDKGSEQWGNLSNVDLGGWEGDILRGAGTQWTPQIEIDTMQSNTPLADQRRMIELLAVLAPYAQMPDPWRPGQMMVQVRKILEKIVRSAGIIETGSVIPAEPSEADKVAMLLKALAEAKMTVDQLQQAIQQLKADNTQLAKIARQAQGEAESGAAKVKAMEDQSREDKLSTIVNKIAPKGGDTNGR
jgi:hypothetical protein